MIQLGVGEKISDEERRALEAEEEEAERLLLAGKEAIQARFVPFTFVFLLAGTRDGADGPLNVSGNSKARCTSPTRTFEKVGDLYACLFPSRATLLTIFFGTDRLEWEGVQSQIRESNSRTVMIDGHAVLKETIVRRRPPSLPWALQPLN